MLDCECSNAVPFFLTFSTLSQMLHSEQQPITPAQRSLLDLLQGPGQAAQFLDHLVVTLDLSIANYRNNTPDDDPAVLTRITADAWCGQLQVIQCIAHLAAERPQ